MTIIVTINFIFSSEWWQSTYHSCTLYLNINIVEYSAHFMCIYFKLYANCTSIFNDFQCNFHEKPVENTYYLKNHNKIEAVLSQSWNLVYTILRPIERLGKNFKIFITWQHGQSGVWKWAFLLKKPNRGFLIWYHSNSICQHASFKEWKCLF